MVSHMFPGRRIVWLFAGFGVCGVSSDCVGFGYNFSSIEMFVLPIEAILLNVHARDIAVL
jgi:hypothetical protein